MRRRRILTAAVSALAAGLMFLAGMYVARATPGGESRKFLTFSGRLTGRAGPQTLTFTFRKDATTVCAPMVTATPDGAGNFSVEIPLATCTASLFDGSDVTVEIAVGSTVLAAARPINPVPYALYADRVGTPDCPLGYERAVDASLPPGAIVCRKGADQMVRVGAGPQAFWIDRYLNSLWRNSDGSGAQVMTGGASTLAADGSYATPTYALSKVGTPSSHSLSYFQAQALCQIVGKRLPSYDEMLRAAQGNPGYLRQWTPRPDECPGARTFDYNTGTTPQCVSAWGAEQILGYRFHPTRELHVDTRNPYNLSVFIFGAATNLPIHVFTYPVYTAGSPGSPVIWTDLGLRCMIAR
jgi:hypothetical protein